MKYLILATSILLLSAPACNESRKSGETTGEYPAVLSAGIS